LFRLLLLGAVATRSRSPEARFQSGILWPPRLDILQGRKTLIDYSGRNRYALAGDERNLKLAWSPAVVSAGSLFISCTIGTTHLGRLLFDTGSGPFTVEVFPATWDALPGLPGPTTPPTPVEGHNYDGALLHVQGKLVAGTVILGQKTLTPPLVYEMLKNLHGSASSTLHRRPYGSNRLPTVVPFQAALNVGSSGREQ